LTLRRHKPVPDRCGRLWVGGYWNMPGADELNRRTFMASSASKEGCMSNLERALEIATEAHDGQLDKTGRPYLEHCQRIADVVDTLDEKIVGYLHDVIGKSGWTRSGLEAEGFSPAIVSAVDALTRREEEDDLSFVRRA